MSVKIEKWKYSRPPHIPEGQREFLHPCGCKEYEEDGVWHLKQCPGHQIEIDALVRRLREGLERAN